jgi:hypothetical protein
LTIQYILDILFLMPLTLEDLKNIENIMDLKLKPIQDRMDTFVTKNEFTTFVDNILARFDRLESEHYSLASQVERLESKALISR